jgi:hypothetical protein
MSDFNYQDYLRNNPLLKEKVLEEKLITESENKNVEESTDVEEVMDIDRKGNKKPETGGSDATKYKAAAKKVSEDARTDAEQEGYKDGFEDAKDDIEGALKKMKVSELKAKIKEDIISLLQEDEEEVDVEDEVEIDVEEPVVDTAPEADAGLSSDEMEIQNSLKLAYDNAVAIGDQKLADQIGNSITFFTRTHVVER